MPTLDLAHLTLHYRLDGAADGAPLMFINSLGTELSLWDDVIAHLPAGLRIVRFDLRGHGASGCPPPPYTMGGLIRDAERLLDHLNIAGAAIVGLSIGGMIAQGLAVKRPDLVRALVMSNTAAKIGTPALWRDRIADVDRLGMDAIADAVMDRWFGRNFRETGAHKPWRNMLLRQPVEGYKGCCAAIAGTDFYTPTSGLRLPTLGIAGAEDRATPPDLVRETIELIPEAEMVLMRGVGHLPCVEKPVDYAALLQSFLERNSHL
ncbi:3-oxoadipate enol-lactonase [Roseovarius pelagicus]|uniref:3-oxoadipate enol-lactonase n=1 Tax=Roseovarius pelagicus TaxID=2980108 RepID=A0ABY6DAR4_9RHOB|nr:3-oxoadipate enol-lactonase [Roseovarius pelagicus]UXX83236.1 3-oxoadipate enol-lactonase [Roseovarius pelagicus]